MKRKFFTIATVAILAGSISFSSCVGPFNLHRKLSDWNTNLTGNKFVNELVFLALNIVPVYGVVYFVDAVVLNSIEFWTGSNPVQAGIVKEVEGENGIHYTITTTEDGYKIEDEAGQEMELIYNQEENTWNSVIGENVTKLVKIEGENAVVYLSNGEKNVELTALGVLSLRMEVANSMFLAAK